MNDDPRLKMERQLKTLDAKITMFEYELDKLEREAQAKMIQPLNRLRGIRTQLRESSETLEHKEGDAWVEFTDEVEALVTELEDKLQPETILHRHDPHSSKNDQCVVVKNT